MKRLVDSVIDPATLRVIEFEPDAITLRFIDGGTIYISVDNDGLLVVDNEDR